MKKMKPFKEEYSFEDRCEESKEIIAKYPERVPVIAERFARSDLPGMEKRNMQEADSSASVARKLVRYGPAGPVHNIFLRYLVPRDMSIGQFIHILSCRLHLAPGKALFVFVNNTLPQTSSLVESIYESYKDEDGFLYMLYSSEKTFG